MRRATLIRKIRRAAQRQGIPFGSTGVGTRHELFLLGSTEIGERITEDIFHECQSELGEGLVADMKMYRAELERDGRFWRVRVPDIERSTQARSLSEAEAMVRDLIAVMTDVPRTRSMWT
jgi:hypothetical protein